MAPTTPVSEPDDTDPQVVHEAWLRACRFDELLSRFPPPASLPLVTDLLERARTNTQPPDVVLAGHASGLSAPQWDASGEVVQRQIGQLMLAIAGHSSIEPGTLAHAHMVVSAAAARVSSEAWRSEAQTDVLTGLRNENGLRVDMNALRDGTPVQIGFLDLDGLKAVNDSDGGHAAGDRIIRDFGGRLGAAVREAGGTAYRPHGDEFVVIMPREKGDLASVLDQLESTPDLRFSWGVAAWPDDDDDIETVRRRADQAMYAMKARHKAETTPSETPTAESPS